MCIALNGLLQGTYDNEASNILLFTWQDHFLTKAFKNSTWHKSSKKKEKKSSACSDQTMAWWTSMLRSALFSHTVQSSSVLYNSEKRWSHIWQYWPHNQSMLLLLLTMLPSFSFCHLTPHENSNQHFLGVAISKTHSSAVSSQITAFKTNKKSNLT